jgi:hypothetical protein
MSETIIINIKPDWVQAGLAKTLCGIPKPTLMRIAAEGKVRSKRAEDRMENCTTTTTRVYRYADILEWLEKDCIDGTAPVDKEVA